MAGKNNTRFVDNAGMGDLIWNKDWSDSPLGPKKEWPTSLRTVVNSMLCTRHPMLIFWGPDKICLYNDAFSVSLGPEKHPSMLGEPGRKFFEEIWDDIVGPQIESIMNGGGSILKENEMVPIYRHGKLDEVYWTYSYSPIKSEKGGKIEGVLVICTETTQSVKDELKIRESEERLQIALETGKLGTWELELSNYHITASETCKSNFGLPLDAELTYKKLKGLIHPKDTQKWNKLVNKAIRQQTDFELEIRILSKYDTEHWIFARGQPFYNEKGTPERIIGVTQNITDRKRNEQLLIEQKRLLEVIATGAPLEEGLSSLCSSVPKLSPGVRAAVLLTDNENNRFYKVIAPDMKSRFSEKLEDAPINAQRVGTCGEAIYSGKEVTCDNIEEDDSWSNEWRDVCLDNGIRACHSIPIPGRDGKFAGSFMLGFRSPRKPSRWEKRLATFGMHIASIALEQENTKRALQENEERMRHILDSAKEYAIIALDEERNITSWNDGATRLLGFKEEEAIGKSGDIFFTPEDRKKNEPEKEMLQANAHGRAENERWHMRKDGSVFWGSGVMLPLVSSDERGFVKIFRDSTAQRQAEIAVQASEHKYRSLFNSIDEGFCIIEKVETESGQPNDFRYVEANPAFEKQAGIKNVRGKTIREVLPSIEEKWLDLYNEVVETRQTLNTENSLEEIDRTFEIHAFPIENPEKNRIAVLFIDITNRKKTELFLKKNEERAVFFTALNDAFRSLFDPIAIQDEATRVLGEHLGVNRVGYGEIEADGTIIVHGIYTDGVENITGLHDINNFSPERLKLLKSGNTVVVENIEQDLALSDKQKKMYEKLQIGAHITVPLLKRGKLIAILSVQNAEAREWRDEEVALIEETAERTWSAVEHARAEKQLRKSEKKYRSLFESIDEGFCILTKVDTAEDEPSDYRYLEINPAFEAQAGISNPVGKTIRETMPSPNEDLFQKYDKVVDTGEPERFEISMGEVIYSIYVFKKVDDREGKIAVIFNDITEQRKAEVDLRRSEERLKAALEGTGVGVWDLNLDENTAWRSPKHDQIFGYSSTLDNWNYDIFKEHLLPDYHKEVDQKLEEALKNHGKWEFECRIQRRDGVKRWISVRGRVLQNGERKKARRLVGTVQDITERKQDEEKLEAINENLEVRVRERTEALLSYQNQLRSLASQLSRTEEHERQRLAADLHDNLGQLLAMCKLELDLLEGKISDGSHLDQITDLVNQAISYTRELMSDLKPPPSLDEKDIAASVEWVADKMKKHGLEVSIKDDDKPKPLNEEIRAALLQSVRESLYNVVKHAKVRKAEIKLTRLDRQILISVVDEGVGFEPGKKKMGIDEKGGFGLFSIRERLDLLGGQVKIHSKPGEGTKVNLFAPLLDEKLASPASTHNGPARQAEISYQETDRIRVLLVDDHQMMLKGLRKIIEQQDDLKVIAEATNGQEAVKLAKEFTPDVIVMDVDMPIMNGIDATREIISSIENVRIIGLSLHEKGEVAQAMRNAGASAYLTKTEAFEALSATIRSEAVLAKK